MDFRVPSTTQGHPRMTKLLFMHISKLFSYVNPSQVKSTNQAICRYISIQKYCIHKYCIYTNMYYCKYCIHKHPKFFFTVSAFNTALVKKEARACWHRQPLYLMYQRQIKGGRKKKKEKKEQTEPKSRCL